MVVRRLLIILVAAVALAAAGLSYIYLNRQGPEAAGGIAIGGPIQLTDQNGAKFDSASLAGKPYAVFFGYTHCPDVCPTTLAESTAWKEELGIAPDQLRTIFVTVDPARDTKDVLADYLASFPGTIGLVGTTQQTAEAAASFGAVAELGEPDADGFYLVNHTASVFLINTTLGGAGAAANPAPMTSRSVARTIGCLAPAKLRAARQLTYVAGQSTCSASRRGTRSAMPIPVALPWLPGVSSSTAMHR